MVYSYIFSILRKQKALSVAYISMTTIEILSESLTIVLVYQSFAVFQIHQPGHESQIIEAIRQPIVHLSPALQFVLLLQLAAITQLVRALAEYGSNVTNGLIAANALTEISLRLTDLILFTPLHHSQVLESGSILESSSSGPSSLKTFIVDTGKLVNLILLSGAYFIGLFILSPPMIVSALLMISVFILVQKRILGYIRYTSENIISSSTSLSQYLMDAFRGRRYLQSNSLTTFFRDQFLITLNTYKEFLLRRTYAKEVIGPLAGFLPILVLAFVSIVVYLTSGESDLSRLMASLVTFALLLQRLGASFSSIGKITNRLKESTASLKYLTDLLSLRFPYRYLPNPGTTSTSLSILSFHEVSYTYPNTQVPALRDISFSIKLPTRVAIVGNSGAGKTCLLDLIIGLAMPSAGEIRFYDNNGEWISSSPPSSLFAVVSQHDFLFGRSIYDNLVYGITDISESTLDSALDSARCSSFINSLELGINTPLLEGSAGLSGGQIQRLLIARALLRNKQILVLDEATSALDYQNSIDILNGIMRHYPSISIVITSHNPMHWSLCDKIVLLSNGELIAFDSHDSLLESNSLYRDMYFNSAEM